MRFPILMFALLALRGMSAAAAPPEDFFLRFADSTLRVDLHHIGAADEELYVLDRLLLGGRWAGNPRRPIDPLGCGRYRVTLQDIVTNEVIYTRGFDTYFGEYRTTEPAKQGIRRTFQETILVPWPRSPVRFVIERRNRENLYAPLWSCRVDPSDFHILRESPARGATVVTSHGGGDPRATVDLVVLAEGYTLAERLKFEQDVRRFTETFFSWEPYRSHQQRFCIRGVFAPSPESGVDEPRQGTFRTTLLDASFNALDTDRYLLAENNRAVHDLAGHAPYDAILIMVNSTRYGGGGIYNYSTIFTSDGGWPEHVFHHEFGHGFAALADEYFSGDVAYSEFFPPGIEPVEPNITALLDPARLKWKDLVSPGLALPTPWGRATYDSLTTLRDSLASAQHAALTALASRNASAEEIQQVRTDFSRRIGEVQKRVRAFFLEHPLRGKVGAFEGAGYASHGMYRPTVNSLMHHFFEEEKSFYPVNERAIVRVIDFLTR